MQQCIENIENIAPAFHCEHSVYKVVLILGKLSLPYHNDFLDNVWMCGDDVLIHACPEPSQWIGDARHDAAESVQLPMCTFSTLNRTLDEEFNLEYMCATVSASDILL